LPIPVPVAEIKETSAVEISSHSSAYQDESDSADIHDSNRKNVQDIEDISPIRGTPTV
jgi:hypothetical protein